MKTERAYLGGRINVMTQALPVEDGSLPRAYLAKCIYRADDQQQKCHCNSEVQQGYPQTLKKKTLVA